MLAANEAVAERLHKAGAGALYRIHEQPDPERVEEFVELVASFGYRVPGNLEEVRPEDFQLVLRQIEGKPEEKLVSYLLLRTMKLARYHEENLGHFGLATEMYAHFTSPIRRYPDLVVHRALRALRQGQDAGAGGLAPGAARDGPPPLRDGAPGLGRRARADRVEEGPLHGGQARRDVRRLRHRRAGVRALRRARGDLRPGAGARLLDDATTTTASTRRPTCSGREHREGLPAGRQGRGAGRARRPRAAADRLRARGRARARRQGDEAPAAGGAPRSGAPAAAAGARAGPGRGAGAGRAGPVGDAAH